MSDSVNSDVNDTKVLENHGDQRTLLEPGDGPSRAGKDFRVGCIVGQVTGNGRTLDLLTLGGIDWF